MARGKLETRLRLSALDGPPTWPAWLLAAALMLGAALAWRDMTGARQGLDAATGTRDAMARKVFVLARRPRGHPLPSFDESRERLMSMASLARTLEIEVSPKLKGRKTTWNARFASRPEDMLLAARFLELLLRVVPLDQVTIEIKGGGLVLKGEIKT